MRRAVGLLALLVAAVIGRQEAGAQQAGAREAGAREAGATEAGAREAGGNDRLRCVALSSIDRTEVIDDRTIAFFLIGGRVYLNHLDRVCRNLARDRPFSYRTSTGQLCAIDVINVVEDFGLGANIGDTCGLGEFVLTDEVEIEVLKGERDPIDVEVEEVEVDESEGEDAEVEREDVGAAADPATSAAREPVP